MHEYVPIVRREPWPGPDLAVPRVDSPNPRRFRKLLQWRFSMITASNAVARISLAATLLCGVVLSGCGKGGDNQAAAPKGQVVAHIGNDVITTQELENEFRLDNIPADKQKDTETLKRVLGDLVARKYLVRQAIESKLDREPGVLLDNLR